MIMTIDELYQFCIENKFYKFSVDESDSELCVVMPASFEADTKENNRHTEGLTPFVSKAFHDHINLNKTEIQEDTFKENLPSAEYRPILANIVFDEETNTKDFGAHDFHIELNEDGEEVYIYDEKPIGVVCVGNSIEYDEKAGVNRAILHGYLFDGYCQDAIDILNRRGTINCSVELRIRELSFNAKEKVMTLDDYYVSGLTLLGEKHAPGMKGSTFKIEDFTAKKDTYTLNDMMQELETTIVKYKAIFSKENSEKGGIELNKFEELLQKYNKTLEDIDFEYEELSDDELEAKFAELFDEETPAEENDEEETLDNTDEDLEDEKESEETDKDTEDADEDLDESDEVEEEKFVKLFELSHDDIRYGLYKLLEAFEIEENEWFYISAVYDDYFVYESMSGKIYGQKYSKDEDSIEFVDERWELFAELLTVSEKAELESMRSNYSSIFEELQTYKKAEEIADKLTIFEDASYAQYLDTEDFKSLMSEESLESNSKEELLTKAELAFSKLVKKEGNFSLRKEVKPTKVAVAFGAIGKETENSFLEKLKNR